MYQKGMPSFQIESNQIFIEHLPCTKTRVVNKNWTRIGQTLFSDWAYTNLNYNANLILNVAWDSYKIKS